MTGVRRFSCTMCGKCCNRSPEVELSEAAALAGQFVFRLMFRVYRLPRIFRGTPGGSELFYQKKRLLSAHAARRIAGKEMREGKTVETISYLMVSALAMDTRPGHCAALDMGRCTIHEMRPLGCRTVPLHYSRIEGLALSDFDAFVATPGFKCDTSENAPLFIADGKILDGEVLEAREDALALARKDQVWKEAIVRQMKSGRRTGSGLPGLDEVEANAGLAVLTSSMGIAWDIAEKAGLMSNCEVRAVGRLQLETIERELALGQCTLEDRETLIEMRSDYGLRIAA